VRRILRHQAGKDKPSWLRIFPNSEQTRLVYDRLAVTSYSAFTVPFTSVLIQIMAPKRTCSHMRAVLEIIQESHGACTS
jgi:hypothetical protein